MIWHMEDHRVEFYSEEQCRMLQVLISSAMTCEYRVQKKVSKNFEGALDPQFEFGPSRLYGIKKWGGILM